MPKEKKEKSWISTMLGVIAIIGILLAASEYPTEKAPKAEIEIYPVDYWEQPVFGKTRWAGIKIENKNDFTWENPQVKIWGNKKYKVNLRDIDPRGIVEIEFDNFKNRRGKGFDLGEEPLKGIIIVTKKLKGEWAFEHKMRNPVE